MIRLHNARTGVRIVVTDDKAAKLTGSAYFASFKPVPDDQQLSEHESNELDRRAAEAKAAMRKQRGRSDISAAIADGAPENRSA